MTQERGCKAQRTKMLERRFVPFDVFGMREEVRVSTMVRVRDLGWTCGMCPLDVNSAVVAAGDLPKQANFVCEMIKTVFARAGFEPKDAAKLVIYHAAKSTVELEQMLDVVRGHFPSQPVLMPVLLDHFYYEGMLLEVDAYADASLEPAAAPFSNKFQIRQGKNFTYVAAHAASLSQIDSALSHLDLTGENALTAQWYSSETLDGWSREGASFPPLAHDFVQVEARDTQSLSADLTFARHCPVAAKETAEGVVVRRAGDLVMLSAAAGRSDLNLVEQTKVVMDRLDQTLSKEALEWAHVVKISAPYVGDASEADLHENLKIRHGFHAKPGPASTGLPVRSFLDRPCKIVVRLIAHR